MAHRRVIIMGAAGRDFHTFNVLFHNDPSVRVVAFTAAQIPHIANRRYPPQLAGSFYPDGIQILPESALDDAIGRLAADEVIFAHSDVSFACLMERAAQVIPIASSDAMIDEVGEKRFPPSPPAPLTRGAGSRSFDMPQQLP